MARPLPDPDISLRETADFITNSALARKALRCSRLAAFPVFLRDLLESIHRLVVSCHLPEFTDHGLHHLCSLVDRVSQWTCAPLKGSPSKLIEWIDESEAAVLLISVLIHDIGMLSQKPEDLSESDPQRFDQGRMDISEWVRKTHVRRIRGLVSRLFQDGEHSQILESSEMTCAYLVAEAHEKWPWEKGFSDLDGKLPGLAAILAVSDLLDEGTNRCDTMTLIKHREGSTLNKAHWIRHTLTAERVFVKEGGIHVKLSRPPNTDAQLEALYITLRNHFRLPLLYNPPLSLIGAGLLSISFDPNSGCPSRESESLENWRRIPGFATQKSLLFHLLSSFFPAALMDNRRLAADEIDRLKGIGLTPPDLGQFYKISGEKEARSPYEQEFHALISE